MQMTEKYAPQKEIDHSHAKLSEKIAYGIGTLSYCLESSVISAYIMLYCTDVLVIKVGLIGALISCMKVIDAISDVIVTSIADCHVNRFGKYRIWLLFGIADAIFLFLFFLDPPFLQSETMKTVWVCVIYVLLVPVIETAIVCPLFALNTTISVHPQDRTQLSLSRGMGESLAAVIMSTLTMPIILKFGTSHHDPAGWRVMAGIFGVIILICTFIGFCGVKERVINDNLREDGMQMNLTDKIRLTKGNRPFWKSVGIIVLYNFHYFLSISVFNYYCIYVLGHEEWVSPLSSTGFGVWIAINIALFFLSDRFEKRTLIICGALSVIIGNTFLFFAHDYGMATAYQVFLGLGNGILNCVGFSLLPDVSDYTEWKTGKQIPGMISAFATFAFKLGSAVAIFLGSQLLDLAGYDGTLAVQSEHTCHVIRVFCPTASIVIIAILLIAAFFLRELNKEKLLAYRNEIDTLRT